MLLKCVAIVIFCILIITSATNMNEKIKNIVVLMLENRSFDHMLGFMSSTRNDIDGCTPERGIICSNPIDPSDPNSDLVYVSNDAVAKISFDPWHGFIDTRFQIFGTHSVDNNTNIYHPPMSGFIKSSSTITRKIKPQHEGLFIMKCFDENSLPILTTLAKEFAVIDNWFSGIGGPSIPNRLMALRGFIDGITTNYAINAFMKRHIRGLDGLNIFEMIDKYSINKDFSWNIFSGDFPVALSLKYVRSYPEKIHLIDKFYEKVENGDLPFFSWIEPSYFDIWGTNHRATDEHPIHDVNVGEAFVKNIYESLRVSPIWDQTLLVILYDEHGGFFDHVPPPLCPNADADVNDNINNNPDLSRLGIRVPVVLVSPWIKKGTSSSNVDENMSDNGSQFCHSSLIHTIRKEYTVDSPPLSKREDWSLTFENFINLDEMRRDCPITLPSVAMASDNENEESIGLGKDKNVNAIHLFTSSIAADISGNWDKVEKYISNGDSSQSKLGKFVLDCFNEWKNIKCNVNVDSYAYLFYIVVTWNGCFVYGVNKYVSIVIGIIVLWINYKIWIKMCRNQNKSEKNQIKYDLVKNKL